jgi:hypothetical protein
MTESRTEELTERRQCSPRAAKPALHSGDV